MISFHLICSDGYKMILKEIFEGLGFLSVEDFKEANIIFIQLPFEIDEPTFVKVSSDGEKLVFFIPSSVLKEIKECEYLESKYAILQPHSILNFLAFIKKELKIENWIVFNSFGSFNYS